MARLDSTNPLPGFDPTPNVATADEIRQAEELRHRLEEWYLAATPAGSCHGQARPGNDR